MKIITHLLLVIFAGLMLSAPDALAAGKKRIQNHTAFPVTVVLIIRSGSNPRDEAGTKDVHLMPYQFLSVDYGDDKDIYLNGIRLSTILNDERIGAEYLIVGASSPLDQQLNGRNTIVISLANRAFSFTTFDR